MVIRYNLNENPLGENSFELVYNFNIFKHGEILRIRLTVDSDGNTDPYLKNKPFIFYSVVIDHDIVTKELFNRCLKIIKESFGRDLYFPVMPLVEEKQYYNDYIEKYNCDSIIDNNFKRYKL